ncbi:MAG: ATP-binding cassette domain-containing protein [Roseburia sp.]
MKINNLCFNYGKNIILKDITYTFDTGKVYGIVGHNGAGKTTLLRAILGLITPTSGTVINDGKMTFSYVPERQGVYSELTVYQNLYIAYKLHNEFKSHNIDEELKKWHLHKKKNELARNLSTGMLARLKYLCANVQNANILICDEPTMGVDARTQKLMEDEIKSQKDQGKTVIITSHNLQFIEDVCDEVIIINEHKIVFAGKIEDIHNFEALYLEYTEEEEDV